MRQPRCDAQAPVAPLVRRAAGPQAVHADEIVLDRLVAEHRIARSALSDDVGGQARACLAVDSRVGNLDLRKYAAVNADQYLERVRALLTARAREAHFVLR